jgi:hypothetical protein
MRTLFIIPLVLMSLVPSKSFGIEYMPKFEMDLFCNEITAKAHYPDRPSDNVAMDGEGLEVKIRPTHLSTKYPTSKYPDKFDYVSGQFNKPQQYINLSFIQKESGGIWGNKTVTFMWDGSRKKTWLVMTEPMVMSGQLLIRTHYYECGTLE